MIELRVASTPVDLEAWAELKSRVVPNEPVTAEQLAATDEPGRLLLLAERDGMLAGCGIAALSNFGGRIFIAARVLPEHRGHGVGRELVRALTEHGRGLGRDGINAFVDAEDSAALAFVRSYGLREVDYQLELGAIVGQRCRRVTPEDAEGAIFGFTVLSDWVGRQPTRVGTRGGLFGRSDACALPGTAVRARFLT